MVSSFNYVTIKKGLEIIIEKLSAYIHIRFWILANFCKNVIHIEAILRLQ